MSDRDKPEPSEITTRTQDPNPKAGSIPRIPTSEIKQPAGLFSRLARSASRSTENDDDAASDTEDTAPGYHDDWVKTEPTGALAYTPEASDAVEQARPRTDHVLPSGSVDLPGSPDDRSKTEPVWDGITPRTAEVPVAAPPTDTPTPGGKGAATPPARDTDQAGEAPAPTSPEQRIKPARTASRKTRPGWPGTTPGGSTQGGTTPAGDAAATPAAGSTRKPAPWKIPAARRPKPAPKSPPTTTAVPIDPAVARVSNVLPPEARTGPTNTAAPKTAPRPTRPAPAPFHAPNPLPTVARAAGKATPAAKRAFSKLMHTESPPTQAFSIVDRLVGSPYANPLIQTPGEYDANARQTLEFALDMAESMFRFGAGALQAETSVIAVTASLGLSNVDVEITNQSIHINYAPQDQNPVSLLRVVRSWTGNYRGLALLHGLVSEIIAGGVTRTQATERLHEILRQPKPYPRWLATVGGGGFCAAFVMFIGGSWFGALVALVSFCLITGIMNVVGGWKVPEFFTIGLGSAVTTGIAMLLWAVNAPISPAVVVAGGIMLLLPSSRFVSAVQDAINGFPVTAAGRFFSSMLIYGAIIAGITAALVTGTLLGMRRLDVANIDQITYPTAFLAFLVGVAVFCVSLFEQTARSLLLPTAGVALTGYLAYLLAQSVGVGDRMAPAVAAIVVGGVGRWVAMKMTAPQLVVAVPAVTFLLPGLTIFRAMYGITIDAGDMSVGLLQMFNAFAIIVAIAGGVVLGDTVARPFTKGWITHERRRIRRR
ncbi:MAG: threonine/serine exporter family protein [Micrococcaceae bacterium]|nr:threonine/serine exporter family protein [Micrococcaceae bacterium]MDN5812404.1 threonine/serine exporter family protein [Micrococcaceae bacterium]